MGQKVSITMTDDLTGDELKEGAGETVSFSLDGQQWEIDLSKKNADKLRGEFMDYIAVARKVSGGRGRKAPGSTAKSGRSDLADVRAWAKDQGMEVSERGRVSQDVLTAYDAAH